MRGRSAVESSGTAVRGFWCRLRGPACASGRLILIVGEVGTNGSGNVPTAGLKVLRSLFKDEGSVSLWFVS